MIGTKASSQPCLKQRAWVSFEKAEPDTVGDDNSRDNAKRPFQQRPLPKQNAAARQTPDAYANDYPRKAQGLVPGEPMSTIFCRQNAPLLVNVNAPPDDQYAWNMAHYRENDFSNAPAGCFDSITMVIVSLSEIVLGSASMVLTPVFSPTEKSQRRRAGNSRIANARSTRGPLERSH